MLAIDGMVLTGAIWQIRCSTNMALMAFLDSEVHNDKTCSKTCLKSFETLKTQLDDLSIEFNKYEFDLENYKRGLTSVEEQLVFYKKNEVLFCEQLAVLKRDISYKDSEISMLKTGVRKRLKQGDRPKWLFDIDVLTKLMNYVPVVSGTNSNDSVGTEESNASNDEPQPSSDVEKKDNEGVSQESRIDDRGLKIVLKIPTVTTAPLEATHADFFGDETEVDMSNITFTYPVPSTPNTRNHKDYSLDHMIGDIQSGVLTRRMTKTSNEQGFISAVYEGKTHEDLYTCLFAYFLSQIEPKKVIQALTDLSWIEAMQDELL
ncbi:hypothetical protein Tco_0534142 [Tanacetum coccineum]